MAMNVTWSCQNFIFFPSPSSSSSSADFLFRIFLCKKYFFATFGLVNCRFLLLLLLPFWRVYCTSNKATHRAVYTHRRVYTRNRKKNSDIRSGYNNRAHNTTLRFVQLLFDNWNRLTADYRRIHSTRANDQWCVPRSTHTHTQINEFYFVIRRKARTARIEQLCECVVHVYSFRNYWMNCRITFGVEWDRWMWSVRQQLLCYALLLFIPFHRFTHPSATTTCSTHTAHMLRNANVTSFYCIVSCTLYVLMNLYCVSARHWDEIFLLFV